MESGLNLESIFVICSYCLNQFHPSSPSGSTRQLQWDLSDQWPGAGAQEMSQRVRDHLFIQKDPCDTYYHIFSIHI